MLTYLLALKGKTQNIHLHFFLHRHALNKKKQKNNILDVAL